MKNITLISHNLLGYECLKELVNICNNHDFNINTVVTRKKTSFLTDQCFFF